MYIHIYLEFIYYFNFRAKSKFTVQKCRCTNIFFSPCISQRKDTDLINLSSLTIRKQLISFIYPATSAFRTGSAVRREAGIGWRAALARRQCVRCTFNETYELRSSRAEKFRGQRILSSSLVFRNNAIYSTHSPVSVSLWSQCEWMLSLLSPWLPLAPLCSAVTLRKFIKFTSLPTNFI